MRYIGSKKKFEIDFTDILKDIKYDSVLDAFSGTGVVSYFFKKLNKNIISNDVQYYSYCISKSLLDTNINNEELTNILNELNEIDKNTKGFIYKNYSEDSGRLFFTNENAIHIDSILKVLNKKYKDSKYYYRILHILLEAVSKISNTTGVYQAYLKKFYKNSLNPLILINEDIECVYKNYTCYNMDIHKLIEHIDNVDLVYLDPPYNNRQYSTNYHILETIARNDTPELKGKSGFRQDSFISDFCKKTKIKEEFEKLSKSLYNKCNYILLSYSNCGIITKTDIIHIFGKHFNLIQDKDIIYKKYKSNTRTNNNNSNVSNDNNVVEYLLLFEKIIQPFKELNIIYQWVGGKTKIMNKILENIPTKINTYIEPFLGGGSVFLNTRPKKAIINDINNCICDIFSNVKNGYDICKNITQRFEELKNNTENDNELYYKLRNDFNTNKSFIDFLILNRFCYNGLYRENSKGYFNVPYNKKPIKNFINEEYIQNIENIKSYMNMNTIDIYNYDYKDIIRMAKEGDFVYVDPPYYPKNDTLFTKYNKIDFKKEDHEELKNELDNLDKKNIKFLLSNSDTKFIRELYKDYTIIDITTNAVLNCKKDKRKNTYNELLIKNF